MKGMHPKVPIAQVVDLQHSFSDRNSLIR